MISKKKFDKKFHTGSKYCKTSPPNKKLGVGKAYRCSICLHQNECAEGSTLKTAAREFNKILRSM